MDLDFSEEQDMLREMVRGLCDEYASIDVVREMEDDPTGYPAEFWKQLGELGLLGLLIPEAYGGGDQTPLEAVIVYEEFGRALAPSPHFVSAVISALTLLRGGGESQKTTWLPKIATGEAILTPAWLEPHNGYGPRGVQVRAEASGDGFRISGEKRHVAFASSASRLLVLARSGDGETDVDLFLVDPNAGGVTLTQQHTLSSDTQYKVEFDGALVAAQDRIGGAGSGWEIFDDVMHDGIILQGAQAIGGAKRALEMTSTYAQDRKQFDRPLAAFQAISHYLADASTKIDGGEVLVHEAAWARAEGKDTSALAPMSKLFACTTYKDVTKMALQVYGGYGFTIEYDIQLFFRRAKQMQLAWWDTSYLEELVARTVLD